ncbi:hypothetical protein [Paracoccus lutimaris]|uniref:hypothetical protein n=1 Tax=Paracoccus lutimaris TaxID=1490030 RepID=UPI000DF33989|nr:hypothetical protein [Paracoccus lutimaris]
MLRPEGILTLLDSRSFGSIWFWVLLMFVWTVAGRRIAGVPLDVVHAAARAEGAAANDPAAITLLDWLSLTLPRWRATGPESVILLGIAAFFLTTLALLGFLYNLEMARALVLLILPFALVFALELRLAHRLRAVLVQAEQGAPIDQAASQAATLMRRHRMLFVLISILSVALAAFHGALWTLQHPFGF